MRRREFMGLVGGAAVAWPPGARAQPTKIYRVGALLLGIADAESFKTELREGLRSSGYVEGRNIQIEFRSAGGNAGLLPKLASEIVAFKPDVIVALYTPCALAAQKATRDIPIVVLSGDPLGSGLVTTLARPGGNVTGMSLMAAELHGKFVELFRDMLSSLRRVAVLLNAADPLWKPIKEQVQLAGKGLGIEVAPITMVRAANEIDAAFADMKKGGADAVVVHGSLATKEVAELAVRHGLPAAAQSRAFAEVGGLMSYGPDGPDVFRRSALFVTKILEGGNPANMPIEQPTKFQLVVNLKTAKTLRLAIPNNFLARADEVIE